MEKTVYNCEICSFKLTTKPNLARHIYYRHCMKRPLYCPICGVTGKSVNNLINHGASIHSQEITPLMCSERQMRTIDEKKCIMMENFDCVYCGEVFESTQKLEVHQKDHNGERPFVCPICNRMFQEYGQAVVHGIAIHSTEITPRTTADEKRPDLGNEPKEPIKKFNMRKTIVIETEDDVGVRKSALRKKSSHSPGSNGHHRDDDKSEDSSDENGDQSKKKMRSKNVGPNGVTRFKCEFCGTYKTSMANLKSHYLVHSNEKNFYCEICGRAFKHYYNVITHAKKFHSKEVTPRPILNDERKFLEKNFMVNVNNGIKTELKARNSTTTTIPVTPSPTVTQNGSSDSHQHVTIVAVAPSDPSTHQTIITLPSLTTSSSHHHQHHHHHQQQHVHSQSSTVTNGVLVTTSYDTAQQQHLNDLANHNDQHHMQQGHRLIQQPDQNVELTYLKNFSSQTNQNHFMFHYADFTEIGNNYGNSMNGEIEINLDETFTDPNCNHLYTEKT